MHASNSYRPPARRHPSTAWSRLKAASSSVDPLEAVGLPSKGDTKLEDFKAQETYYKHITERYVKFCANSGSRDELEQQFASMAISQLEGVTSNVKPTSGPTDSPSGATKGTTASSGPSSSATTTTPPANHRSSDGGVVISSELATILSAMRKLREALVATHRLDNFAQRAYVFIIRAAILVKHMESYHPALSYLLHQIHPRVPLPPSELQEFVGYRILDLACRQEDYNAAYRVRHQYKYRGRLVDGVLDALVHDNWILLWRMRQDVDGYERRLIEFAEDRMRRHALKSLARSYFTVEKSYLEKCALLLWEDLVEKKYVGWQLDDNRVVIRRPKAK